MAIQKLTIRDIERLMKLHLPPDDKRRLKKFHSIINRTSRDMLALAAKGHSSISIAAEAFGRQCLMMSRLRAVSNKEVRQLRILEMAYELGLDPTTWNFDGRTFIAFRDTGHSGWKDYIRKVIKGAAEKKFGKERAQEYYHDVTILLPYPSKESELRLKEFLPKR